MVNNINIANDYGVFSAVVDADFNTAENLFFASGSIYGSAVLNQGGIIGRSILSRASGHLLTTPRTVKFSLRTARLSASRRAVKQFR